MEKSLLVDDVFDSNQKKIGSVERTTPHFFSCNNKRYRWDYARSAYVEADVQFQITEIKIHGK